MKCDFNCSNSLSLFLIYVYFLDLWMMKKLYEISLCWMKNQNQQQKENIVKICENRWIKTKQFNKVNFNKKYELKLISIYSLNK